MSPRLVRTPGRVLVIMACAPAIGSVAGGQVTPSPPTLEASSRVAGAVPSQTMDTGTIPASANNQATVSDSFSGPVQIGTVTLGSGIANVSASSSEGTIKLFSQVSDAATLATVAIVTNVEAKAFDSVQITQLPGGQGQLSALYFPTMLAGGGTITGTGSAWSGTIRLTVTIQDFGADGSLRAGYTLAADYTNGNAGPASHDTGPVTIPVQLHDTLTMDADETLQTSASAARGATAAVIADFSHSTHMYLVPLTSALAFSSASGHNYLPIAGDADVSGTVDFSDLLLLAQHYGANGATWSQGDFNADGTVDFGDLLALAQHYGQTADDVQLSAVPEPSASAPLVAGAASFLSRRRQS